MLVVDTTSAVPPFEQLRIQLVAQIERGELPPGTQLPTVRRLAAELGLAPNTVARTYRELEQAGVVQTAGRRGTVVATRPVDVGEEARRSATEFVQHVRTLGLHRTETLDLVRQALDADDAQTAPRAEPRHHPAFSSSVILTPQMEAQVP